MTRQAPVLGYGNNYTTHTGSTEEYGMKELTSSVLTIIVLTAPPPDITRAEVSPIAARSSFETTETSSEWPVLPGWPYQMPELIAPEGIAPVVADLDGDGGMEIAVLTYHELRVLTPIGAMDSGAWPLELPVDFGTANLNLSAANMDDDTDLEILFSRNQPSLVDPQEVDVHVFNHDGTYAPGWPRTVTGLASTGFSVSDLDTDGRNEVVIGTFRPARVYVLRDDGTPFSDAWPVDFTFQVQALATADLDGDGDLEILVNDHIPDSPDAIHALHHDGTGVKGWPVWLPGESRSDFVIGDIDHDGIPEIAIAAVGFGIENSRVHLWNARGEPFNAAWPVVLPVSSSPWSVAMGDVDADGYLDVLVTGHMREVFAIDRFGTFLPGWPALIPFPFSGAIAYQNIIHAVADMDADGMPEVVVGALIGPCIFNHDATPLPGANPLPVEPPRTNARLPLTATVADVDLDGDVELFSGIWRTLYAWDFPGPECSVQWPRSSGNLGNTGAVTPPAVDTSEWVLFNACFTGPAADSLPPECECLDSDADSDIDLHDFARLQRAFTP